MLIVTRVFGGWEAELTADDPDNADGEDCDDDR